jgi:hypothetical protein
VDGRPLAVRDDPGIIPFAPSLLVRPTMSASPDVDLEGAEEVRFVFADGARLRTAAGTARNSFKLKKLVLTTHKCCQQPLDAIALLGCGEYCNDERPNARICRLRPGICSDHNHGVVSAFAAVAGMVRDRSSSTSTDAILFPHA